MVDVVFNTINSDGVNNSTTLMLTYKIDESDINTTPNSIVQSLTGSNMDFTQYPEVLEFNNTYFAGQEVEGCVLVGNNYTCKVYDYITINGDITIANNYHVDFIAGTEIYVVGESNISEEAVLQIQPVLDNSQPMPKVDQSYVTNFCNSQGENGYQANTPSRRAVAMTEAKELIDKLNKLRVFDMKLG